MRKYYYIGTLLPTLSFNTVPEISFEKLNALFKDNLTPQDYKKTLVLRRFYDLLNLRALWLEQEIDPRGVLTTLELEDALLSGTGLDEFVYEFIDKYPNIEERLHHFPSLIASFFQDAKNINDPFLRHYMNFEREMRLVMTAFRAKKLGRDLAVELQYENPEEDLIAQLLAEQDAKNYEPPEKYKELKEIFAKFGDNPLALEKALDEYRIQKIDSLVDMSDTFSIERILAYFAQFLIIEKWFELDKSKGIKIIDTIVKENHGTNG